MAAVLHRGPSKWVELIKWNTKTDTFTRGHWLHGRIYEEKCDLSPDGQLFVYFAFKHGRIDEGYDRRYTAVSKLPWLTALALWPNGTTYGGGGSFIGNRELAIAFGYPLEAHPNHLPERLSVRFGQGVVYATHGRTTDQAGKEFRIQGGKILRNRRGSEVEIADFTSDTPTAVMPPEWATRRNAV